jgi:predicted AlkP superfamily phosphohydrolase/phosphomutase
MTRRKEVALWLMRRYPWDLLFIEFMGTEIFQDKFFGHARAMENFFLWVDGLLSELYRAALKKDPDTVLFVVSDHGHVESHRQVNLNSLLSKLLGQEAGLGSHVTTGMYELVSGFVRDPPRVAKKVAWLVNRPVKRAVDKFIRLGIGFPHSRAFYLYFFRGIFINSSDRFESGRVGPGERRQMVSKLAEQLPQLIDPETGGRPIREVHLSDELYQGPYAPEAPDLLVCHNPKYLILDCGPSYAPALATFGHARDGIFLVYGRGIRGVNLNADILDVAPTILHLLGTPTPPDMDGTVLTDIFESNA